MRLRHVQKVTLVLMATVLVPMQVGAGPGEPGHTGSTVARLLATEAAALDSFPGARARREAIAADAAGVVAAAAPGAPYLEWQREGIGPRLTHRGNGQTTVRAGIPFAPPWRSPRPGWLEETGSAWRSAADNRLRLDVAGETAGRWLEMAATVERLEIVRGRLARLERAVRLQEKRLELGEISGMELTQLRLERARWLSTRAALEADSAMKGERLRELCGDGCAPPRPGDMEALVEVTRTPQDRAQTADALQRAPGWTMAETRRELEEGRWRMAAASAAGYPEVEVEWESIPALDGLPAYDAAGVRLRVPLPFGRAVRTARLEAEARRRAAEASWAAERVRRTRELEGLLEAAGRVERGLQGVGEVLRDGKQTEHSLAEQFRLGAISYLVYIDGLGRLDDVRLVAVDAKQRLLATRLKIATLLADPRCFPLLVNEDKEGGR